MCVALTTLVGCGRIGFDAASSDAPPTDAVVTLACNMPVRVGPAATTSSHLVAAGSTVHAAMAWIEDSGSIGAQALQFPAPDVIVVEPAAQLDPGIPRDLLAMAATPTRFGIAAASTSTFNTVLRVVDDSDASILGTGATTVLDINSPYGLAADSDPSTPFVVVGTSATGSSLVAFDAMANQQGQLANGAADTRQSVYDLGNGDLVLIEQTTTNDCEANVVPYGIGSAGTAQGWAAGVCSHPVLAHLGGHPDLGVFRHDLGDGEINAGVGAVGANIVIASEQTLATNADEPRAVAVTSGYWVSFATGGMLAAVHPDFTLPALPPQVVLGPLADPTAHAIFAMNDTAYVVWIEGRVLFIARLC